MIAQLLAERFPHEYDLNTDNLKLDISTFDTPFILTDHKSCNQCHLNSQRADRNDCNEEILKINPSGKTVSVINFEDYIVQFCKTKLKVNKRCDYLLFDDSNNHYKIAFCDLTCSEEKWVEKNKGSYPDGKRAFATLQMMQSIEYLLHEPLLSVAILTFSEKVCIFGWREYNVPAVPKVPNRRSFTANVEAFLTTPSNMAKTLKTDVKCLDHDFHFIQVKYPTEYNWKD